nr:hypothetical protein [Comamonas koreensis]
MATFIHSGGVVLVTGYWWLNSTAKAAAKRNASKLLAWCRRCGFMRASV